MALLVLAVRNEAVGQERWVELRYGYGTHTYDLKAVQMVDRGRFTIIKNSQDDPDIIRLKLTALEELRASCSRPAGQYEPPRQLLTLGAPDIDVEKIEVKTSQTQKIITWHLPYRRLAIEYRNHLDGSLMLFACIGSRNSVEEEYRDMRSTIMNGSHSKELYDCRHGVMGLFVNIDDPISEAITTPNISGAFLLAYLRLCPVVVGGSPYISSNWLGRQ